MGCSDICHGHVLGHEEECIDCQSVCMHGVAVTHCHGCLARHWHMAATCISVLHRRPPPTAAAAHTAAVFVWGVCRLLITAQRLFSISVCCQYILLLLVGGLWPYFGFGNWQLTAGCGWQCLSGCAQLAAAALTSVIIVLCNMDLVQQPSWPVWFEAAAALAFHCTVKFASLQLYIPS